MRHQYVERASGRICTECLYGDRIVQNVCPQEAEDGAWLYRALTSRRMTAFLAAVNFDTVLGARLTGSISFMRSLGVDLSECLDDPGTLNTPRKIFERKIRYEQTRPLPDDTAMVVSPCDARLLVGSLDTVKALNLKGKFFDLIELLGNGPNARRFTDGDFAVFRLTPEKYHYNHCPVSGVVRDIFTLDGRYAPCNPGCVIRLAEPFSKNRRVVTIIDTDCPGGTGVGRVAMVEVVALMIGDIVQAYSSTGYACPRSVVPGLFLRRGQPKSLFRPGSSTVVLLFEKDRIVFHADILRNLSCRAESRFSAGFDRPLVETEVWVRSAIAAARTRAQSTHVPDLPAEGTVSLSREVIL